MLTRSASSARPAASARTSLDSPLLVTSTSTHTSPHEGAHDLGKEARHGQATTTSEKMSGAESLARPASPLFGAGGAVDWNEVSTAVRECACRLDEFNQYLVEDLFSTSSDPITATSANTAPQCKGPPLIPIGSRPRSSAPLAFPDVNAPDAELGPGLATMRAYSPLTFDRVQARHAAFDSVLVSPLLDAGGEGSVWDGSPAWSDSSPLCSDIGVGGSWSPGLDMGDEGSSSLQLFDALSFGPGLAAVPELTTQAEVYSSVVAPAQQSDHGPAPRVVERTTQAHRYSPVITLVDLPGVDVSPAAPLPPLAFTPTPAPAPSISPTHLPTLPVAAAPLRPTRPARTTRAPASTAFDPRAPRVALDAPTRARAYQTESRTSAKPVPKRLRAAARAVEVEEVVDEAELVSEAERRRRANTLAARVSRARKAAELELLRARVGELEEENERLRCVNERLVVELEVERAGKRRKVEV